jgi:hypothetical protein
MYPITTTAITNISRPMYIGDNTFLISDSNTYNTTTGSAAYVSNQTGPQGTLSIAN